MDQMQPTFEQPSIGVFKPKRRHVRRPTFKSKHNISELRIKELPSARGFSFNMDPPYVSFKTLRSMDDGCGEIARHVISTKSRSWITPDYVYDNLLNYCYPTKSRFGCPVYDQVLLELKKQFVPDVKIKPLEYREAARTIPQSTSPGIPWIYLAPGKKKDVILDHNLDDFDNFWKAGVIKRNLPLLDCAAFARSHIGNVGENKVRPVWAYPLPVVAAEAMFATPYIQALKDQTVGRNTAYGMEMLKGGMEWLNHQLLAAKYRDTGAKFLMVHFSAFDSSVPAWLIQDCFSILLSSFDFPKEKSAYYCKVFRFLVSYFINTPVRNSDGRRLITDHGIPSGSMFTDIIGTMVNFVVTRYTIKRVTLADAIFDIYFGDDGFLCLPSTSLINIEVIKDLIYEGFGMNLNQKKSYWTNRPENVHFLGYYNDRGTPFKPSVELFASMLYPQYNKDDWAYTLSRAMGCLMASAGNDNNVYKAVLSIYNRAKSHDGVTDVALRLIRENPRMRRYIINLGCDPDEISYKYLHDYRLAVPNSDCSKMMHNVRMV